MTVDGAEPPLPGTAPPSTPPPVLLRVRGLHTRFSTARGSVYAVNGVSFSLRRGESMALVGESGCGKSATVLSLLGLLPTRSASVTAQEMSFQEQDLLTIDEEAMRRIRGAQIGMIFQDPRGSLNPVLTVGRQLTESLEVHMGLRPGQARARAIELMRSVGVPDPEARLDDYPHQFSGGMCQRVMIAMALGCAPSLLIADEPTTALDVTIQAQIVELIAAHRAEHDMTMIWISHDLSVVAQLADRVAVMYAGLIVEYAPTREIFGSARHPYTRGLLASVPSMEGPIVDSLSAVPGQPPDMSMQPVGCAFADRCPHVLQRCRTDRPTLSEAAPGTFVACWWDTQADRERELA
jgi:oligopeptide/dipeptide ABC transporter ATP-binding protein